MRVPQIVPQIRTVIASRTTVGRAQSVGAEEANEADDRTAMITITIMTMEMEMEMGLQSLSADRVANRARMHTKRCRRTNKLRLP